MEYKEKKFFYEEAITPHAINIYDEKVCISMELNRKHSKIDIAIVNKNKFNRKKIQLKDYINLLKEYIKTHNIYYYQQKNDIFQTDLLEIKNIRRLEIVGLKLESTDILSIGNTFKELFIFETKKCTLYNNCCLGILKCNLRDYNSDIYGLDIYNGFQGRSLEFYGSNIRKDNKHLLHLYNIRTMFRGVDINFEKFFLTTEAPNMRRIDIFRCPKYPNLKHKDLLFISGFYNLEGINIDAIIENYDQIDKLEKLRKVERIAVTSDKELQVADQDKKYKKFIQKNTLTKKELERFRTGYRLYIQNRYADFKNKIYVPRIEKIKFENKIQTKNEEKIKQELLEINQMEYQERKRFLKEEKTQPTLLEQAFDLDFDIKEYPYEEWYLTDSRPFESDGIKFYTRNKQIIKIKD